MPFPDFQKSLAVLDDKRCGKQRSETLILHRTLFKTGKVAWMNHPAKLMWEGYADALALYLYFNLEDWESRGFKNSMEVIPIQGKNFSTFDNLEIKLDSKNYRYIITGKLEDEEQEIIVDLPWWFFWDDFHFSHQASLLRKFPEFYNGKFETPEKNKNHGYLWPSKIDLLSDNLTDLNEICAPIMKPQPKKKKEKTQTVVELKKIAKEKGIKGYYKMNKKELLELLKN